MELYICQTSAALAVRRKQKAENYTCRMENNIEGAANKEETAKETDSDDRETDTKKTG